MTATAASRPDVAQGLRHLAGALLPIVLWVTVFGGAFVFIEPSPYEFAFVLLTAVVLMRGMAVPVVLVVPFVLLALFNVGGVLSLLEIDSPSTRQVQFIAISFYLALTTFILALIVAEDPDRLRIIRSASIVAALVTALAGIAGYFNVAGLAELFTENDRARGTFKDPNVMGPFLILPALFLLGNLLNGRKRDMLAALIPLAIIMTALLLSFSRGAWGHVVLSFIAFGWLSFVTSSSSGARIKIVVSALAAVLAAMMLVAAMLSVPQVAELFQERAKLVQSYDAGERGRFGKHRAAIPDLFKHPNGYGALQFRYRFGEDPHNVYINAFASYGWLGGITYLAFTLITLLAAAVTVFRRTPMQPYAIAFASTFGVLTLLGLVIDTDHWRHYYLLAGCIWGMYAATLRYRAPPRNVS